MNPHYKFTGDMEKKILARYLSGESSGFLAKEYSCDRSVITKMAKRYGHGEYASMVKGGVRGINTSHLNEKITKLHGDGLSQRVIGEAVGISQCVVSRVLRQLQLKPNRILSSKKGNESHFWKGGKIVTSGGYIGVLAQDKFPIMQTKSGYIMEHRLVMAEYLGRPLKQEETVHHIDGNKSNNTIENLQLRIGKHGRGVVYKCAHCGSIDLVCSELTED